MPKKPRSCFNCSHRYVCRYMMELKKLMEEMPWNVKSVFYYDLVQKPMFSLVAKRCDHFEWIKND